MQGTHIDKGLHFVYRKEMTGYIQHGPAIGKAWFVVNFYCRKTYIYILGNGQRLSQGLDSVKDSSFGSSGNTNPLVVYHKFIGFFIIVTQIERQTNSTVDRHSGPGIQFQPRLFGYISRQ